MKLWAFVPLSTAVLAGAAGGLLGLSQSPDPAPWEGDRSDIPVTVALDSEALDCAASVTAAVIDYAPFADIVPSDVGDPLTQAQWVVINDSALAASDADLAYIWTDHGPTTGQIEVYDPAGERADVPVMLVDFELVQGIWLAGGWVTCLDG